MAGCRVPKVYSGANERHRREVTKGTCREEEREVRRSDSELTEILSGIVPG